MVAAKDGVLRFGAFAPQGWKTELIGIEGAANKWAMCRDIALQAEQLGYDSIWVYDHFHNVPTPTHEAVFECWTVMAALAEATNHIRLGQMVSCTSYRSPAGVSGWPSPPSRSRRSRPTRRRARSPRWDGGSPGPRS